MKKNRLNLRVNHNCFLQLSYFFIDNFGDGPTRRKYLTPLNTFVQVGHD